MTNSSDPSNSSKGRWQRRNVTAPDKAASKAQVYSRFIPREELDRFSAWSPNALEGGPDAPRHGVERRSAARNEPDAAAAAAAAAAQATAARQAGYQDGYRDGLSALEAFKQTYAAQVGAQLGALVGAFDRQFDDLQRQMAAALAQAAVRLARQVVRGELQARPELVAAVANDAVEALLASARHVVVRVHPDDQPLVAQGAGDALAARGARLVVDPSLARGGCAVESDIGTVDATIAARWARAAAALGSDLAWDPDQAP